MLLLPEDSIDPNGRYAKAAEKNLVAPPIFPVALIPDLFREILSDDHRGDLLRMVHGEQRMRFNGVPCAWDLVTPRGTVAAIDTKESGELLHVDQTLYREGKLLVEMRTSLFFRGASKGTGTPQPPEKDGGRLRDCGDTCSLSIVPKCGKVVHMIEVSIARLRSRLAAILDAARAGEEIVIRRHGTRLAILTGFRTRAGTVRRSLSEPSKLPRAMDTGPVSPIRLRAKLRRSPAQELAEERE